MEILSFITEIHFSSAPASSLSSHQSKLYDLNGFSPLKSCLLNNSLSLQMVNCQDFNSGYSVSDWLRAWTWNQEVECSTPPIFNTLTDIQEIMDMLCVRLFLLSFLPILAVSNTLKLERAFPVGRNLTELIHRDLVRHQRIGIIDFPLLGSANVYSFGFYFTKVRIGSPPREFNLLVDTGSDITWVSCKPCIGCHTFNKFGIQLSLYDPSNSSSASWISCSDQRCLTKSCSKRDSLCSYNVQYFEDSTTMGTLVSDVFHFDTIVGRSAGANTSKPVIFGCANHQTGRMTKSYTRVDGILGLGHLRTSVISQLSQQIIPNVFSHCLNWNNGGVILVLGEILVPGIVYTPLVPSRFGYKLNLQNITLNDKAIKIDPTVFASKIGTIVDSGTTLIFLTEMSYDHFMNDLVASVSQFAQPIIFESNQYFQVSGRVYDIFPLIRFNFEGGASMTLRPKDYLIWNVIDDFEAWCTEFRKGHGQSMTIIGEMALKDKIVIYDLYRQRLGWVSYNCSQPVNVDAMNKKHPSASSSMLATHRTYLISSSLALLFYVNMFL